MTTLAHPPHAPYTAYSLAWCMEFYATTHGPQYAEALHGVSPEAVCCTLYTASLIATPQQRVVLELFRTLLLRAGIDPTTAENRAALTNADRTARTLALPLETVEDMVLHDDPTATAVHRLFQLVDEGSWHLRAYVLKKGMTHGDKN